MKKQWFTSKDYGYGWRPATWQGYLSIAIYIIGLIVAGWVFIGRAENLSVKDYSIYLAVQAVLTAALIFLSYKKGPKPHWRWGKKSKISKSKTEK